VEEYDVDAVDDFDGEEARKVVVVTVVVIFASSHTTRMPRALLLFIHILFRFVLKAKVLFALCLSLLSEKREY